LNFRIGQQPVGAALFGRSCLDAERLPAEKASKSL